MRSNVGEGEYPMSPQRQSYFAGMLIALALGSGWPLAQEQYPNRTVKLIVPTSPGAVTDIIARALGQALSQSWGQPFVSTTAPGATKRSALRPREIAARRLYEWC